MEKEKRKYFPEEEMQGRKRREIFREGKHFGLWWESRMEKEKRENLLETKNVTDHQTRIKFNQNLQIQRPGIPVDRWVPLSPPEGKITGCILKSFLHLFIGPGSDHSLPMSVTHSLTESQTCWRFNELTLFDGIKYLGNDDIEMKLRFSCQQLVTIGKAGNSCNSCKGWRQWIDS